MTAAVAKEPVLLLCGPTASGKTALAVELAQRFDLEVVSADSRQVYREMDIGTAKPTAAERARAPHHLLDVVTPDTPFSVGDYVTLARTAIADIFARGKRPIVVGGTGLYLRGLVGGLADLPEGDEGLRQQLAAEERAQPGCLYRRLSQVDPTQADRIHPQNLVRVTRALEVFLLTGTPLSRLQAEHAFAETPYRTLMLGLNPGRPVVIERIHQRTRQMVEMGLVDECRALLQRYDPAGKALKTLGYREIIEHLHGVLTLDQAVEKIQVQTRRYAKRQMTWFNGDPSVKWLDSSDISVNLLQLIIDFYAH